MTVHNHTVTTVTPAQRLAEATTLVDNFRADLRLACETRPFPDAFADGLAARYFGGTAILPPVGALIYLVRAGAAATRQRMNHPKQDCQNAWGDPLAMSCAEQIYLDLENEAAEALINVLLHGPWPI